MGGGAAASDGWERVRGGKFCPFQPKISSSAGIPFFSRNESHYFDIQQNLSIMEFLHRVNIVVHIVAGTIALVTGLMAVCVSKKSSAHRRFGRYFMWAMVFVILTGITGVFVFKRNTFLLVITLLSGHTCFSGIRAIRLRGQKPGVIDLFVPLGVMAAAVYYLYYIRSQGLYWAPVIIYSTMGALFLVTVYDLCKPLLPAGLRKKAVPYEHVYKMISSLSGISSAFSGTVFPNYKPYSQFLPSVIGVVLIIVIFIRLSRKPSFLAATRLK
jgi:hypothetical protein